MPRGDGTGPQGKGAGTGRGQGKCINKKGKPASSGEAGGRPSIGSNRGQGLGNGRRGMRGPGQV